MGRGPAAVIVDSSGNELTIVDDSGTYRLALPSGAATEATVATLATETKLEAVRVLLASLDGKDYATETTLGTLATESKLEAVRMLLASLDAKDFATQTTLAAADSKLGTIDTDTSQMVLDIQELLTRFGDDVASPAADTLLARVQELIDNIGSGASPVTDTVQARLQETIDLLTTIDVDTSNLDVSLSTRATEVTLDAIRDNIGESGAPAADTLIARIQELIDLLTSIKDTDGVQIIDDIVRVGDVNREGINSALNTGIRRLEARTSITSPNGVSDVAVVTDNSVNRLETRTTVAGQVGGAGAETKVTVIQDTEDPNEHRLQTESRIAPGSTINIGTAVPSDPSDLVIEFLETTGPSEDMLVNGSGTPVVYTFGPTGSDIWSLQDVLIVFTADDFEFDGTSFGPNASLANGVLIELVQNSVVTQLFTIRQNEDFLRVPGRLPLVNNTGPKDVLSAALSFGGLVKLDGSLGDNVRATIRDNLTGVKLKYLTMTGYATKD